MLLTSTTNPTNMHPYLLFLLSLGLVLPLSEASSPPFHHPKSLAVPPQEYIEVTRPLSFDSLTPSCTLPFFSHIFSNTSGHPGAANATYSPPTNCSWSNAVLHFSASANGSDRGRTASVWLSGVELLRTNTPDPTSDGVFWNFSKDVTRYSSLLRRSNLTLSVVLYHFLPSQTYPVNITLLYYNVNTTAAVNKSLELNKNPADMIIPISSSSSSTNRDREGLWFMIEQESDPLYEEIKIPANTYRAVIEIYVSSHAEDELWYTNPPDYYLEINNLSMRGGHGPHREVIVRVDDDVVGSVIPFPTIMSGGINPLFWEPLVSIGAFDFPSYELELTPFLGPLSNNNLHFLKLEVADALPYWLVDANIHLWLDKDSENVEAGPVKYIDPRSCLDRESKFHGLDGKCKVGGERKMEVSGRVSSSAGNFTTHVYSKVEFDSKIVFKRNGTKKTVKQEVKVSDKVEVRSDSGGLVSGISRERRYPLRVTTTVVQGSEKDTYLVSAEMEHALMEERKEKGLGFKGKEERRQKCRGWMFVRGCEILSGAATTTSQTYYVSDGYGCYTRRVVAEGGAVKNETDNVVCATSAAAA